MEFFKTYKSGLRVVGKLMPSLFTVSLGVYVNVGSIREEKNQNGLSHFVEHLLFKGTSNRTASDISEEMDSIGADSNAFTSKDNTCYYTKSASTDLEKCIDVLSDMYFNSLFDSSEIDKERGVILEEIALNDDLPEDLCQDLISEALFKGQKLGQTILGNAENVQYYDRHSILDFKENHYFPKNTVVSIAGNFDFDQLDKLIEKYFESNFQKCDKLPQEEETSIFSSDFLYKFKAVEQSHLAISLPGQNISSEIFAPYILMSKILGGGMSSRLFQTIREENGLAYSVYSFPSSYKNSGCLDIYCGINPQNTQKTVALLEKVLQDFVSKGITEKELARAKSKEINGLYMGLEGSLNVMFAYGRRMLKLNNIFDVKQRVDAYQSVTLEDINSVIKSTFSQPFASCYVGKEQKHFDAISKIKLF